MFLRFQFFLENKIFLISFRLCQTHGNVYIEILAFGCFRVKYQIVYCLNRTEWVGYLLNINGTKKGQTLHIYWKKIQRKINYMS
jgi:hypothetical protein